MTDTRTRFGRYRLLAGLFALFLAIRPSVTAQPIIPDPDEVPAAAPALAFTGATVVIRPGEVITEATVVIRRGLIEAVGRRIAPPFDARVIDATGLTIYPGFIDAYSWAGMPETKRQEAKVERPGDPPPARAGLTPDRQASRLFDRNARSVDSLRRAGFTLAHVVPRDGFLSGLGALMLLGASDTARYTYASDVSLAATFDGANDVYPATPMGIIASLRNLFRQADLLRRQGDAHRQDPRGYTRPTDDPIRTPLLATLDRGRPLVMRAEDDLEARRVLSLGEELAIPVVVAGLKRTSGYFPDAPTILSLDFPEEVKDRESEGEGRDSVEMDIDDLPRGDSIGRPTPIDLAEIQQINRRTDDYSEIDGERLRLVAVRDEARRAALSLPKRAADSGVRFGFGTAGAPVAKATDLLRAAVKAGLPADRAVAALTVDAARILGVERSFGSIETGKVGNLVVASGEYFGDSTEIRMTVVDGLLFDYREELAEAKRSREKGKKRGDGAEDEESDFPVLTATNAADPVSPGRRVAFERDMSGTVLIRNGTLLTIADGVKQQTDLLIRNGMIAAIGKGLSVPSGGTVIDATDMYVMPGIIDAHSHIAVSGPVNEWTSPVTAEVRIGDVLDPYDITLYRALAGGVTVSHVMHGSANPIGGECETIKHRYGELDPERLKMEGAPRTIKFALGENPTRVHGRGYGVTPSSRMGVEQVFRKAFTDATRYMQEWKAYGAASTKEQGRMVPPVYDERLETLAAILRGEVLIHCHSYRADEIVMLLGVLRDFGVGKITFQHVNEGFKVAPELAEFGAMASVFSDWWAYKLEVYYSTAYNAAILTRNGVTTSINSDSPELNRHLFHEAAKSMRHGDLTEEECLAMITINPARQLGIDDRVGTLEVGKEGDVAIFTAHPLSIYTTVATTIVDGVVRFDAAGDPDDMRLRIDPEEEIDRVSDDLLEDACMEGVTAEE